MVDKNLSTSNKKSAGKGNGNSIISHKSIKENVEEEKEKSTNGYVGGDLFPSSTGHTFHDKTQNEN